MLKHEEIITWRRNQSDNHGNMPEFTKGKKDGKNLHRVRRKSASDQQSSYLVNGKLLQLTKTLDVWCSKLLNFTINFLIFVTSSFFLNNNCKCLNWLSILYQFLSYFGIFYIYYLLRYDLHLNFHCSYFYVCIVFPVFF